MSHFKCPQCGSTLTVAAVPSKPDAALPDQLASFISERCLVSPEARELMANLISNYMQWCANRGEMSMSPKAFGSAIRRHASITVSRSNGRKFYRGLALIRS